MIHETGTEHRRARSGTGWAVAFVLVTTAIGAGLGAWAGRVTYRCGRNALLCFSPAFVATVTGVYGAIIGLVASAAILLVRWLVTRRTRRTRAQP